MRRYVITKPISKTKDLVKFVNVVNDADNYNAHPTQKLPIIKFYSKGKILEALRWGLIPSWVQEREIRPLINARLETLGEKMTFKNLIKKITNVWSLPTATMNRRGKKTLKLRITLLEKITGQCFF